MAYRPTIVKSIQRGTITLSVGTLSNTATITAVDLTIARLRLLGNTSDDTGTQNPANCVRIELTNSTTITASRKSGTATQIVVSWEVIEYFPNTIKSIQRGSIDMTSAAVATATLSPACVTAKTVLDYLGLETADTTNDSTFADVVLTNTTTVTATRITGVASSTLVGWQTIEFK